MGPAERITTGIVVLGLAAAGFAAGRIVLRPRQPVVQPIAFNHRLHTETLECETCHEYVNVGAHSGLPDLTICLECHEDALTESPEEEKVRELARSGEDQVFHKLFTLPDNVFYTHRRHVGIAGLECATCHGAIAESETPPERPLVRVTMDFCLDCHRAEGASTDCTRCHR